MTLPNFKYHPDSVDTGSIVRSDVECVCCGIKRGHIYTGPVYSSDEYNECICPWCIADGSAHKRLDAEFHDSAGIPGSDFVGSPQVSLPIIEEVCFRTPGFSGWQQEQWFTCCEDAAAFLGRAGFDELTKRWPDCQRALQESTGLEGDDWNSFLGALSREGSPTAYVFRCLHCGKFGAYQDCD
jgi:uncharacterized protein CbrC (UPF0167 family)